MTALLTPVSLLRTVTVIFPVRLFLPRRTLRQRYYGLNYAHGVYRDLCLSYFWVLSTTRPPHATAEDNNILYRHVRETVHSFTLNHPDCLVYLTGDFNPASTNVSPEICKRSCGRTETVKVVTRDTGILDWFLNSPKWFDDPKQLVKIGTSDHYGVLVRQIKSRAKSNESHVLSKRYKGQSPQGVWSMANHV